jgi:hypothetical protein
MNVAYLHPEMHEDRRSSNDAAAITLQSLVCWRSDSAYSLPVAVWRGPAWMSEQKVEIAGGLRSTNVSVRSLH